MSAMRVLLCIDDEETILDSLSMELAGRFPGVDVELLQDQAEAEPLVRELLAAGNELAVVVCDYIMPGRRGDTVLAAIHALAPAARTVMLTGQSSLDGVTSAINRANLYRYIAKPWNKEDLALTLQGALESHQQDATIQQQNRALHELNENLERKVAERTRELSAANEGLSAANRKISEYLDIIDKHVLISRISREGLVTYVSDALCRKNGCSPADLIGVNFWHALYPSTSEAQMREIRDCIARGEVWRGEVLHRRRDGSHYWADEIISPDQGESVVLGFTSIRQDITEKKVVEEISATDPLTGLHNRRRFDDVLESELRRARRAGRSLAFCMLDVDHFKAYNDHYGHPAGDRVLRRLAEVLRDTFKRACDFCFRVGGEEFALLFPVESPEQARQTAGELLLRVESLGIPHAHSTVGPHLTVSLGMRVVAPEESSLPGEALVQQADALLYRAKEQGRNRYVMHP